MGATSAENVPTADGTRGAANVASTAGATGRITAHDATPFDRVLARVHNCRLDRDLARGVSPEANTLLALRAHFLVYPAVRDD